MIKDLLDHLVNEKMDIEEYEELMEEAEDINLKEMLRHIREDECNHYKMIKEYITQRIEA